MWKSRWSTQECIKHVSLYSKDHITLLNKSTKSVFYRVEILCRDRIGQHRPNVTSLRPFVENTYKSG